MNQIVDSQELKKLLGQENVEYPEESIPYNVSYPHEFIPDTITETKRYINFEISGNIDPRNNVYKDLSIYFYVMCHRDCVRYFEKSREYLWYDRAVCELDNIFCEKNILGIGNTILTSNVPYYPQKNFIGRLIKFIVKDFNNGLKYGK